VKERQIKSDVVSGNVLLWNARTFAF